MNKDTLPASLLIYTGLAAWLALIVLPMVMLYAAPLGPTVEHLPSAQIAELALNSVLLAASVAFAALLLGYVPARLLGTARSHRGLLLFVILMPLLLPRYVLYYAWSLLLSPTAWLGAHVAARPELARFVGTLTSSSVMILWYWPLAALILAQGWRNLDAEALSSARLDTSLSQRFFKVSLPLLVRPLCLAFGVCFALVMSEFSTFHLAGIQTIGTELAVLYELTGSETYVARTAWPLIVPALILAAVLTRGWRNFSLNPPTDRTESTHNPWPWCLLILLSLLSLIAPVVLLLVHLADASPFRQFLALHMDGLVWSIVTATVASLIALLIAGSALAVRKRGALGRCLAGLMCLTIMLSLFLPGSLVAISLLKILSLLHLPSGLAQSWVIVSAGQAVRFAGLSLIVMHFASDGLNRHLTEMASTDGASSVSAWRYVYLPRTWPLFVGTFLLTTMFCLTELPATMVLLPAGLPNFAQRLLNQMHYARDQQVIVSCLLLIAGYLLLAGLVIGLWRLLSIRYLAALLICATILIPGCGNDSATHQEDLVGMFGQAGHARGQFIYPRAIDFAPSDSLFVADKTGRIQRLSLTGQFLDQIDMPQTQAGFTTGISVGPDGNLYVADTHYHRVMVFTPQGQVVREFGRFGSEAGCFIYPTDVAFSDDGRIYVSEYGGNDRISIFSKQGEFISSFGSPGSDSGQLSRPSALCVDQHRRRLYVADACNHRIAVYNLQGELITYIGSLGSQPGQLRYPYDLVLLANGTLAVCEYGNNRLQLFSPQGRSLAIYGRPGRLSGELAYPWGVTTDRRGRLYILDAGNNRVQVWKL